MIRKIRSLSLGLIARIRKWRNYCLLKTRYSIRRLQGFQLGENVAIGPKVEMYGTISIGENTTLVGNTILSGEIEIGRNVIIAADCILLTVNHDFDLCNALPYGTDYINRKIVIEDNVWVGSRVCIAPGTVIGEGSIIGLGSVVRGNIPPLSVVSGNPAEVIRQRNEERYHRLKAEKKHLNQIRRYFPQQVNELKRYHSTYLSKIEQRGFLLSTEVVTSQKELRSSILYNFAMKNNLIFGNAGKYHIAVTPAILSDSLEEVKEKAKEIAALFASDGVDEDLLLRDFVELHEAYALKKKSMRR